MMFYGSKTRFWRDTLIAGFCAAMLSGIPSTLSACLDKRQMPPD
jgi:hypothetical protein